MLPPSMLTEAVAQVGAILILVKPENREKIPFFMGIQRVRYRRPVHPGDVVEIEAIVKRLRSRMGVLRGMPASTANRARRDDDVRARTAHPGATLARATFTTSSTIPTFAARDAHTAHFGSGRKYRQVSSAAGTRIIAPTHRSSIRADDAMPRVSRSNGPVRANAAPA